MQLLSGSLYDYLLFYECAAKDWASAKGVNEKLNIVTNNSGTLMKHINWSVTGTTVPGDSGGNTKCGVTWATWESFFTQSNINKYGLSRLTKNVNSMDKNGWVSFIDWFKISGCANDACTLMLFQAKWGGWGSCRPTRDDCLALLKQKATKPDYNFKTNGGTLEKIADATNAFENPMDAYQIIRNCYQEYMYNLSAPGMKNRKFRVGWMRRVVPPFQDDGLYIETGGIANYGNENTTLDEWRAICAQQKGKMSGYVKLCSWDNMPSSPDTFDNIDLSTIPDSGGSSSGGSSGGSSGSSSSGTASGGNRFSSGRTDPHLSASEKKKAKPGTLLGPSFNLK